MWWTGGGGPPSTLLPPPPIPCLPPFFQRRALRALKLFFCFPSSLFPNFLPSPFPPPHVPLPPLNFPSPSYPVHSYQKFLQLKFCIYCLVWVIMCRHTKPHTSYLYILFSPHHEKTIIFLIGFLWQRRWTFFFLVFSPFFSFFLLFCFVLFVWFFFAFVRNYEKTIVIVMSGWKDDT